jgi:hypothetical protein
MYTISIGIGFSNFFSLSVTMKTNYVKSTGQGNLFSKLDPTIFENNTCIISRLQSRSLTGRNPQIKVHKHFGDHIHLFWQTKTCDVGTTRTIEQYDQMRNFCLTLAGLENLCSCIDPWFFHSTPEDGKVEKCFFAHYSCTLPNWKLIEKQQRYYKQTILHYM